MEDNNLIIKLENENMTLSLSVKESDIDKTFDEIKKFYYSIPGNNQQKSNNQYGTTAGRQSTQSVANQDNKAKLNGGGSKPASPKQKELIQDIANDKKINLDSFLDSHFQKNIESLTGAEANQAIKKMKER